VLQHRRLKVLTGQHLGKGLPMVSVFFLSFAFLEENETFKGLYASCIAAVVTTN